MEVEQVPPSIRTLFARWSLPAMWERFRYARKNLSNQLALEEAELLAAPVARSEPLPTSDGVRRAARELDALGHEHAALAKYLAEQHPGLLTHLPAIPPAAILDAGEAVRCAERVQGLLGRVLERAAQATAGATVKWSDVLDVRDCMFVLKVPKNRAAVVLKEMVGRGDARKENRQRWKLNLATLDRHQRERYDQIRPH